MRDLAATHKQASELVAVILLFAHRELSRSFKIVSAGAPGEFLKFFVTCCRSIVLDPVFQLVTTPANLFFS